VECASFTTLTKMPAVPSSRPFISLAGCYTKLRNACMFNKFIVICSGGSVLILYKYQKFMFCSFFVFYRLLLTFDDAICNIITIILIYYYTRDLRVIEYNLNYYYTYEHIYMSLLLFICTRRIYL